MQTNPTIPAWWTSARFGMFIHWGVYAVPAGSYRGKPIAGASEWLMHSAKIPVAEYKSFAKDFDPKSYDPNQWVRAAKEAGMGYMVITAKHHDGFALFDSKVSDWNVVASTPHGKDLLVPLVEACRAAALPLGFYYSQAQDWVNGGSSFAGPWDPAQERDFDEYIDRLAIPQLRELLALHPSCPILWWDTPAKMSPARAARILETLRSVSPGILQNDRLGGGAKGDFDTPEQRIPAKRPARAWETCMTTNESWGFNSHDLSWKPPALLIRQLCEVASQGGNYLLNIGPKADGSIPSQSLAALKAIGAWMSVHGEAIVGTSAGPFPRRLPWGSATLRDQTVYLLVDTWPKDGLLSVPLLNLPESMHLLGSPGAEIRSSQGQGEILIKVPGVAPDPSVSVIVLRYSSSPQLGAMPPVPRPPMIPQPADGCLTLDASSAELLGEHIALLGTDHPHIGCWTAEDSYPLWRIDLKKAGLYRVEITYAIPAHREGSPAQVDLDGQRLAFTANGTGGWEEFVRSEVGTLHLEAKQELALRILPESVPLGAVMNLRSVHLTPCSQ